MLNYRTEPCQQLSGVITVPGDKSISHRALMLGAIADGRSMIQGCLLGADNLATAKALQQLGVKITIDEKNQKVTVDGVGLQGLSASASPLDLGNAGTGMRLMTGLLAGQNFDSTLIGDESLTTRPMARIVKPLRQMGAQIQMSEQGTAPLQITGGQALQGIDYAMPVASAQVKSCLLLAGLYAKGQTSIQEQLPSRDHTERMLESFGYSVTSQAGRVSLQGGGNLRASAITVPADISSAAFFIVAATITPAADITLKDVGINPTRIGVINILRGMGAEIQLINRRAFGAEPVADIRVRYAEDLQGIEIPTDQVPLAIDEFPAIFIAAACAKGVTTLTGAKELRVKESDRVAAMAEGLSQLGIEAQASADGLRIVGGRLTGGEVNSFADHRIAMAFAIAGSVATDSISIQNCDNVLTSFPNFVRLSTQLGMRVDSEQV